MTTPTNANGGRRSLDRLDGRRAVLADDGTRKTSETGGDDIIEGPE
jgi:hypothetical protein